MAGQQARGHVSLRSGIRRGWVVGRPGTWMNAAAGASTGRHGGFREDRTNGESGVTSPKPIQRPPGLSEG